MSTFVKSQKSEISQKLAAFTGEGAYHGSTKNKGMQSQSNVVPENDPTTISWYLKRPNSFESYFEFEYFNAKFTNKAELKSQLPLPTQEEIKNDGVTFCWTPFEEALAEAGPLTKSVLQEMEKHLERKKKFVYIDSKIQFFKKGDLPVDSKLWHVDGTIAVSDERARALAYDILHDMKARMLGPVAPPQYLAYQSSYHCATEFVTEEVTVPLPDCIRDFNILDGLVNVVNPKRKAQPAASIISFDGFSLHRAVPATEDGWRLWVRCTETDREIKINPSILDCYGTVYRTQ